MGLVRFTTVAILINLMVLFSTLETTSQTTVTYTASNAQFANPERGMYHYIETRASSLNSYNLTTLQNYRLNEEITLIYCINYLDTFASAPISAAFLTHIQQNLDTVRDAGLKCILRFAYTDDWNNETPPFGDATQAQIQAHLEQLEPILQANSDVISVMQAGFIGVWGEWYYTDHFVDDPAVPWVVSAQQWEKRHDILSNMLQILPPSRMVAVRYAHAKQNTLNTTQPLSALQAYDGSEIARIGYHNDCFLASSTDFGTWLDTAGKTYLAADTAYLPMGGETCNPNAPRSSCPTAVTELALFHWSYLNAEYHPTILSDWVDDGCMDDIINALGYRFALQDGTYDDEVKPNEQFSVSINLTNLGYAPPYNPRPVHLLLRAVSTGEVYAVGLPQDPRSWAAGSSVTIAHDICVPADTPLGDYELLLNLPDRSSSLRARPEYSVLFANGNGVQEPATGYNDLLHTLTVTNSAAGSPCTSDLELALHDTSPSAPTLQAGLSNGLMGLAWPTDATHCTYTLYEDSAPYFAPSFSNLYDDTIVIGNQTYDIELDGLNRFYQLQAVNCDGSEHAESNQVGMFVFPLE